MIEPALPPRIEQSDQFSGAGVESGQIWAFELVATVAGEREICELVTAPVLTWDYVLELMP